MARNPARDIEKVVVEPTVNFFDWLGKNLVELSTGAVVAGLVTLGLLFLRRRGRRQLEKRPEDRSVVAIGASLLANISWLFAIIVGLKLVTLYAPLHENVEWLVNQLFIIVAPFQVAIWLRELTMGVTRARAGDATIGSDLENAMSIIRFIVNVTVFTVAAILVLDNLGINVSALLAGLGIGGIAIGLAAKGVFSDLFAALSILFDKPFKRGDSILFDDVDGTVEKIGMMSTRIRSKYGPQLIVSNEKLLDKKIVNETDMSLQRAYIRFPLPAETPAAVLRRLPDMIREVLADIDRTRLHRAAIRDFEDYVLIYEVVIWVRHNSGNLAAQTKSDFIIAMLERFEKEGIRLVTSTPVGLVSKKAEEIAD